MNNFAITSAGIGDALQRSASALFAAGNTLDESVALVTAANAVIQNPEQVGTALKTLSLRLRGAKTELEEAGGDVEGMAENTSQLQAKLKALTHGKVDIMLDADTFKSTTQILREMSAAWEEMTDIERAAALELMGGKRQSNILSSVITNFETVEDVIETSMGSYGSAMAENEKWLDSIEGKTYQFTNALQKMWSNLIDSEVIKGFLGFGTNAIEFLDTGTGKVIAFVAAYKMLSKFKGFSIGGLFKGLQQSLSQINTASQALNALKVADTVDGVFNPSNITAYAAAVSQLTPKLQAQALASKGLSNEQVRQALILNGVDQANIKTAMSQLRLTQSTQQAVAVTGQEAAAILAAQNIKLSDAATNFLQAHSTEEVTNEMLEQAVVAGTLTATEATQIAVSLGLTGANHGLAASFRAIGTSIKFMFMSNPVGFIISIATTILSLIPIFGMFGNEVERTTEEIEQSLESTVGKCNEIANEFKNLKKSANDVIPRFVELSEGVDNFGKNISLTDEEYEEFLELNNKIAEMFPDLNMGFDENGNAMLALSGTADTLSASLWALVEAEREAAKIELAKQLPTALEDINKLSSEYKKEIKDLNREISLLSGGKKSIEVNYSSGSGIALKEELIDLLNKYNIQYTVDETDIFGGKKYGFSWDENAVNGIIAGLQKQVDNKNAEIESKYKSLNPILSAWMQTDFNFTTIDKDLQNIALSWVNGLDFQALGKTTEEDIKKYITDNVIMPLKDATPDAKAAFNELFSIDTSSMSTQQYIDEVNRLINVIADSDGEGGIFTAEGLKKDLGFDDIISGYEKTAKNIQDILSGEGVDVDKLKEQIYSMSPDKLYKSFDLIKKYGIKTWDELQKALSSKTFDVVLNYNTEQEGIEKLNEAIQESLSATGLSAESIANLKSRYEDLEGFDAASLFEETANGIGLNTSALRELEQEYKEQNKEDLDKKLEGLVEQYNKLTGEIEDCSDASKRAQLYSQRQNILDQINDTATLASKYAGLTSAYNEWKNAQSDGSERDMYEDILAGRKEMDEEMSRGWVDEGTRQYLELLSGKDLSKANYEEVLDVYKELNKAINGAGHSVYDFFTKDDDGNATTDGIFNFFDTVKAEQEKLGQNWVRVNEQGQYIFDFGDGGDKAVADALGISEELVQIILRAARDAGFEVNLDTAYSQLADFKDEVQAVNDKLKELGATTYTFNINSTNITDVEKQIEEAKKALEYFYNEDGTLKVGVDASDVEGAKTLLATLIYQKQTLDQAIVLKVDTQNATSGPEGVIGKLQEFKKAFNDFEVKAAIGADTTEAEANITSVINSFANMSDEDKQILVDLGIDLTKSKEEINAAINNLTADQLIKIDIDPTLIEGYQEAEHTTTGTVVWDNNVEKVTTWASKTQTAKGVVTWYNNTSRLIFPGVADGTAHASGTAYAGGSWGAKNTETSLVGELGPEILVRNGKWTTVGENGAEFTQVKKGDIIFNHKQTESLLKNGYVTGRGKAYASGTAFSGGAGPGRFTVEDAYKAGGGAARLEKAADEFLEVFDWIAVRLEEINEELDLEDAKLANKVGYEEQNKSIENMIALNKTLKTNLDAAKTSYEAYASELLSKVNSQYRDLAQNGAIDIDVFKGKIGEKQLEAIKKYREWVQKGADVTQKAENTITEISSLAKQAIDNIATQYDNEASLRDNKADQLEAYNELLENQYGVGSTDIYQALMSKNNTDITELGKKKASMQTELNAKVTSGEIKKYSDDWYDAVNDIAAVDTEIINLKNDNLDLQESMSEVHWYHSDLLMSQLEAVSEEAENLIDVLSNKDAVNENGSWTNEGITMLGLYAQQMEVAQEKAEHYASEINYLNSNWQSLGYTEEEYLDKLKELKSGQHDAIQAYNDSKDAIVDLNKERVDAIKNGIEKEIEAYEELIDKKKEELDAEQDLYDFQKKIRQSTKDIADLERQLAALSADNSASARAKRAQLEAELAEARQEQEDMYYERSISNQQEALDKELENFTDEKNAEIEGWEKYLDDTERVVSDSLATVQQNTQTVLNTLTTIGSEYSLNITETLKSPWTNATGAISNYQTTFGTAVSKTTEQLDALYRKYNAFNGELKTKLDGNSSSDGEGDKHINTVNTNNSGYVEKSYVAPPPTPPTPPESKEIVVGGNIDAGTAKIYREAGASRGYTQYYSQDPKYKVLAINGDWVQVRHHGLTSGVSGWFKKSDIEAYAKGSKGVIDDQWALIDELGDELLLRAHNGRLTYLEKGSGVVPADLTANLMEWGKLDPSVMLDQNRPSVGVHPEVHNTQVQIDNSIGELIHIDKCDQSTLPDIEKMVNRAFEQHTQRLNQSLRKYTR